MREPDPQLVSAVWDGAFQRLVLTFDRDMDQSRTGEPSSYALTEAPLRYSSPLNRTWLNARQLRLSTWDDTTPDAGPNVWSYTPGSDPLRAADGVLFGAVIDQPYEFAP